MNTGLCKGGPLNGKQVAQPGDVYQFAHAGSVYQFHKGVKEWRHKTTGPRSVGNLADAVMKKMQRSG